MFSLYTKVLTFNIRTMNKKKIFLIFFLSLMLIGGVIKAQLSVGQNQPVPSLQMRNNIEALAENEGGGEVDVTCYYPGAVSCPSDISVKVKYFVKRVAN